MRDIQQIWDEIRCIERTRNTPPGTRERLFALRDELSDAERSALIDAEGRRGISLDALRRCSEQRMTPMISTDTINTRPKNPQERYTFQTLALELTLETLDAWGMLLEDCEGRIECGRAYVLAHDHFALAPSGTAKPNVELAYRSTRAEIPEGVSDRLAHRLGVTATVEILRDRDKADRAYRDLLRVAWGYSAKGYPESDDAYFEEQTRDSRELYRLIARYYRNI